MKTRISIALLTLAALVLTITLQAQTPTPSGSLFTINVPFSFVAGETTLPPGQYTVSHFPNSDWILFRNDDGHSIAMLQIMASSAPRGQSGNSKLVFNRYGENYFLAQVWTARSNQVDDCFKSSAERALARGGQAPTQVGVVVYKP